MFAIAISVLIVFLLSLFVAKVVYRYDNKDSAIYVGIITLGCSFVIAMLYLV